MRVGWRSGQRTTSLPPTTILTPAQNRNGGLWQVNLYELTEGLNSTVSTTLSWVDRESERSVTGVISALDMSLGNNLVPVSYLGFQGISSGVSSATFSVSLPGGNDYEIPSTLQFLLMTDGTDPYFVPSDGGWQEIVTITGGCGIASSFRLRAFWRWGTNELNFTLHKSNLQRWNGCLLFYTGVNPNFPVIQQSSSCDTSDVITAPALPITAEGSRIVWLGMNDTADMPNVAPAGYNLIMRSTSPNPSIKVADLAWNLTGAVPAATSSLSAPGANAGAHVAISLASITPLTTTAETTFPLDLLTGTPVYISTVAAGPQTYHIEAELNSL